MTPAPENPPAFPPIIVAAAAKIGRLCDSSAAPLNEEIAAIMLRAFIEMEMTEQPEPEHPTLWRYLDNARKLQITYHSLAAHVMPDGGFHFYIHPASVSGETEDYLIWPDPFKQTDMLVNKKDSPEPNIIKFKQLLAARTQPKPAP